MSENMGYNFTHSIDSAAYEYLGAHLTDGGALFRVWAPAAESVSIVGDFNGWQPGRNPMTALSGGVWEVFVGGLKTYDAYKFAVCTQNGRTLMKADPYAMHAETRPGTASKLYDISGYKWGDGEWFQYRRNHKVYDNPVNIYEVHPGSWRRNPDGSFYDYRRLADELAPYVKSLGMTHIELMPITEHPLDDSWGYQCTGYFSPTSRYGTPTDFMYFVDTCHRAGLGVILDWVPGHFAKDEHGLMEFDGESCYEYTDPLKREHPSWGTMIFDFGKHQVQSFLISSAIFWLREYHIDGLRTDACASMLYLDYGREQWCPNRYGGKENLEAIDFFKKLNQTVFAYDDSILMAAEESTAWPMVTRPVYTGGLGFNLKWNMGWMNDVLHYFKLDPIYRQFNHRDITFSIMYAFSENFLLPLSHDEVVHMKGSLIGKMPGSYDMQLAGVRLFYAYMLAHPGKKLLFMGSEFGQYAEWDFRAQLSWEDLDKPEKAGLHEFFQAAGHFYLSSPELWQQDFDWSGFEWLCQDDVESNVSAFIRRAKDGSELYFIANFSPVFRQDYRLGVPKGGKYRLAFASDDFRYGGGVSAGGTLNSYSPGIHGRPFSVSIDLPPLSAVFFRNEEADT